MKYLDEFRDKKLAERLLKQINNDWAGKLRFMEVCGTHTVAILRSGIKSLLKGKIDLVSGPGCPVCVTSTGDIDRAIAIARLDNVILATFGDMVRVPGSFSSLDKERAQGRDIRVVYSPMDAVKLARENPEQTVVFLGIGFETTIPTIAVSIKSAREAGLNNFRVLSIHKIIPPAMKALLDMGEVNLHGLICPGHVSAIIGSRPYQFVAKDYGVPCVITGFEPLDILQSIHMLMSQVKDKQSKVEIQYSRGVPEVGNPVALQVMDEVLEVSDTSWRGLGVIPGSGLKLKEEYRDFDVRNEFNISIQESKEPAGCMCGEMLRGINEPPDCPLFGKTCTYENPIGPCMVSSEGSCAAYYKYALQK